MVSGVVQEKRVRFGAEDPGLIPCYVSLKFCFSSAFPFFFGNVLLGPRTSLYLFLSFPVGLVQLLNTKPPSPLELRGQAFKSLQLDFPFLDVETGLRLK